MKIGISIGDINGIGPEVIIKTLKNKAILSRCTPIIYGSAKVMAYHKNLVNSGGFNFVTVTDPGSAQEGKINVITCWDDVVDITLGEATETGGKCAYIALDKAVTDLDKGNIDALVTAPINKHAMKMADFPHLGHTEYIADKVGSDDCLMLMVSDKLRVGMVTTHVPLADVTDHITKEAVLDKIEIMHQTLQEDFGIERPIIAVLGLNPHAGDDGEIGEEDQKEVLPAILAAKDKKIMAMGPYPADGFFSGSKYQKVDAVLAMYHDQGLIPFKSLAFGAGVNYTAGLPVVRTSPDHGTGFDIVGQDLAYEGSFRNALFTAMDIVRHRQTYDALTDDKIEKIELQEDESA